MEKVQPLKKEENYMRIWGNSVICDTLVNSILQEIDQFDDVFEIADQAIGQVMTQEVDPSQAISPTGSSIWRPALP